MVRRLIAGVAVLAAAGAAISGCSSQEKDPPEVAWVSNACSYMGKSSAGLRLPQPDAAHPEAARQSIVTFLKSLSSQLDTLSTNLKTQGPPPADVDGGKTTYDRSMNTLSTNQKTLDSATIQLEHAKVNDSKSYQQALANAGKSMQKVTGYKGPAQDFRSNPTLDKAFRKSPECQDLNGTAGVAG